jgi:F0F1-type ATP synthase epsilon subunit
LVFSKIRRQGEEEVFAISGGVIEVQPTIVTVLADAAENVMEIDISRAEQAKRRAETILQEGPPTDADAYEAIEKQLRKSQPATASSPTLPPPPASSYFWQNKDNHATFF